MVIAFPSIQSSISFRSAAGARAEGPKVVSSSSLFTMSRLSIMTLVISGRGVKGAYAGGDCQAEDRDMK